MMIRTCLAGLLTLAMTIPAQAQTSEYRIFRGGAGDVHFEFSGDNQLDRVQDLLDLTEGQMVSLETLQQEHRKITEELAADLMEKRESLKSLVPLGNAAAVGTAYLTMLSASEGLSGRQEQFQTDFSNLLTTDQKDLLDTLKKAGGGTIFRMVGLTGDTGGFMMFRDGGLVEQFGIEPHQ